MSFGCRYAGNHHQLSMRSFTLVEATISLVIVSVMMVAALNTLGAARIGEQKMSDRARAYALAESLISEILSQPYEDMNPGADIGTELGESRDTRLEFDDIDDYHLWSSKPPQYKDGTTIPWASDYTRSVSIELTSFSQPLPDGTSASMKLITVTVERDARVLTSLEAIRTSLVSSPVTFEVIEQ